MLIGGQAASWMMLGKLLLLKLGFEAIVFNSTAFGVYCINFQN